MKSPSTLLLLLVFLSIKFQVPTAVRIHTLLWVRTQYSLGQHFIWFGRELWLYLHRVLENGDSIFHRELGTNLSYYMVQ